MDQKTGEDLDPDGTMARRKKEDRDTGGDRVESRRREKIEIGDVVKTTCTRWGIDRDKVCTMCMCFTF